MLLFDLSEAGFRKGEVQQYLWSRHWHHGRELDSVFRPESEKPHCTKQCLATRKTGKQYSRGLPHFHQIPKGLFFPVLHLTRLSLFSNLSIAIQYVETPWMSSFEQIPERCPLYIWSLLCGGIRVLNKLEKVEDMLHRKGVIGAVMDLSRLKMVNIRVGLFVAGMWKEVMVGDSQRTIISYLETLSVTQLDGQEPALTQAVCASFNRHAFMYVTSLCTLAIQNTTVSVTKNTKMFNIGGYIMTVMIM